MLRSAWLESWTNTSMGPICDSRPGTGRRLVPDRYVHRSRSDSGTAMPTESRRPESRAGRSMLQRRPEPRRSNASRMMRDVTPWRRLSPPPSAAGGRGSDTRLPVRTRGRRRPSRPTYCGPARRRGRAHPPERASRPARTRRRDRTATAGRAARPGVGASRRRRRRQCGTAVPHELAGAHPHAIHPIGGFPEGEREHARRPAVASAPRCGARGLVVFVADVRCG